MVKKHRNIKRLAQIKDKYKKLGARSIYDIIHNTPEMKFVEKINYIRHHYTYYEGHYELFHFNDGKPNPLKYALNDLIGKILKQEKEPSELKKFNKYILNLIKKAQKLKQESNKIDITTLVPRWIIDLGNNYNKTNIYVKIIEKYLENCIDAKTLRLDVITYKKLKELALNWDSKQKDSLYMAHKENKRVYNLMKEYDKEKNVL